MRYVLMVLMLVVTSSGVYASILDYQIVRLIAMDSDCASDELTRTNNDDGTVSFFMTCTNVSHYPDGVIVHCPDATNERSCKVKTESKSFDNLKLLQ
ncbi:MAG: hypothetical protein AAGJ37_08155, partial [Pseudomonadota bacterium]